jgi:amino acid transporter
MSSYGSLKRALLGRQIATAEEQHERLSKTFALPVFSADAISSTAYATEEILIALIAAGTAVLSWSLPVAVAVAGLLAIVALSYRQTVHAYPNGGGSYIVSRINLGLAPGLIAAASLMVGYVATVSVSVAAGVAAITSAFPSLYHYRVVLCMALVVLMALANLRGVRESGRIFAAPTYLFVLMCGGLIVVGFVRWAMGDLHPVASMVPAQRALTWFLVLRAFAGGCAAMTGTEAIANAVPDFRPPESRNAAQTLAIMAGVLGFLLLGVTALAQIIGIIPKDTDTVLSQVGRAVLGDGGFFYYVLQVATMAILILGANTSYAGFPRLSSVMARDGLMPRQFANRGDRLVYSNGIIGLTVVAVVIVWVFEADVSRMVPFYALGVFVGFTLSQAGMVVHWRRLKTKGWRPRAAMNAFGAVITFLVAVILLATRFLDGAYIVVGAVPVLVTFFYWVRAHYRKVALVLVPQSDMDIEQLSQAARAVPRTTVVLFVAQVNSMTARALAIARALAPTDLQAVTISSNRERLLELQSTWEQMDIGISLRVVDSPYREFVRPALGYVRSLHPSPDHSVTVVIPEFVVDHWWEGLLHNQDALRLKASLLRVPWVGVMSIPLHLTAAATAGKMGDLMRAGKVRQVPLAEPEPTAEPEAGPDQGSSAEKAQAPKEG